MKIEKKNGTEQLYFGKVEALQPKRIKADKGTLNLPLFEQVPEDKQQLKLFKESNNEGNNNRK